jgi:hypothetical protein
LTYYRAKYINGHGPYWYEVRSVREGDNVEQQHVRYIGKNKPTDASGQGQRELNQYNAPDRASTSSNSRHVSRKWSAERKRRAQIVAEQVGCSEVEADALIKRADAKGYEYDEVDWDRLQGKDLTYSERVEKLEDRVGSTRTKGEARMRQRAAKRAWDNAEKKQKANGDNYDPEEDLELEYAYRAAQEDYAEDEASRGRKASGYYVEEEV